MIQAAHPNTKTIYHLQMDFVELTPSEGKKFFPTSKKDAAALAQALITEIILRWGITPIPPKLMGYNQVCT